MSAGERGAACAWLRVYFRHSSSGTAREAVPVLPFPAWARSVGCANSANLAASEIVVRARRPFKRAGSWRRKNPGLSGTRVRGRFTLRCACATFASAQRSHMRGHRLCLVLRLRQRNEFAVTRWPPWLWSVTRLVLLDQGVHGVHRSRIARRGLGAARQTGRPLEAVGNEAQSDRLDAVLALVVGDLARSWADRRRTRGLVPGTGQSPANERGEQGWKP